MRLPVMMLRSTGAFSRLRFFDFLSFLPFLLFFFFFSFSFLRCLLGCQGKWWHGGRPEACTRSTYCVTPLRKLPCA